MGAKQMRILLADDDPDESLLFKDALDTLNIPYHFSLAEDGSMLISMLKAPHFKPDIIFLDLNMPGKSGRDCLVEIRRDERFNSIPVIIYSTSSHPKDVDECYKGKANMYAVKCSSFSSLVKLLQTIFHFPSERLLSPVKDKFIVNMAM